MGILETLRKEILSGTREPGSELSQTDIAHDFGVSRLPVRDALYLLAAEKLVTIVPGKGARVCRFSEADLEEIFDLRLLLECELIRRATAAATEADRAEADYAFRKSSLEAGRPGWNDGDWDFHRTLYRPAGRPRQLAMVQELRASCILHASQYETLSSATPQWIQDHEGILSAFQKGAADAAAAILRRHLVAARDNLFAAQRSN